ncbi:hypothetical protein GCM10010470_12590 [Saccharopolyspora taberi]|uniref:Uncharacterized protein n=1 Tax=Saccharopolyspora taberi TaxID=60895 RepID=A0ABN3V690_9PSEU
MVSSHPAASTRKTTASPISCTAGSAADPTNCGRKARLNSSIFGLVMLLRKPRTKGLAVSAGPVAASPPAADSFLVSHSPRRIVAAR